MREVAALAGVSLSTVSRVVNGFDPVDPDVNDRIHRAMVRLGYRRTAPVNRRRGRTATIGLLLEDVANPFSAILLRAVEDAAAARDLRVLAASLDEDPERERDLVASLIGRRVDGFIIAPAADDQSYLVSERRAGTAFVFADRRPRGLSADSVVSDHRGGTADAVGRMLRAGHRRIGYLGDLATIATAAERFAGYREALAAAGVPLDESIVRHDLHNVADAERATVHLLTGDDPPTALFAGQNLVATGAVIALHQLRLQHRVALIGFDDVTLGGLLQPGLSVVAQEVGEVGRLAAERLFGRLDGDTGPANKVVVPTRFVARGSGEIPPPGRQDAAAR